MEYNTDRENKHAFVICAYGKSRYLHACIRSLLNQTVKSSILMVTPTPNEFILDTAKRFGIPLYVREGEKGIENDWNYGYRKAGEVADYVTIAHQDDIYLPEYTEIMLKKIRESARPLFVFCNYAEIRRKSVKRYSVLLGVKRLMLLPMLCKRSWSLVSVRRFILSLGNPIMCPTVMYYPKNLPESLFAPGFISNLDWEAWEKLSLLDGSFVYEPGIHFLHRIHEGSTTTTAIKSKIRREEDMTMFRKFWPESIARILTRVYIVCERSNTISGSKEKNYRRTKC